MPYSFFSWESESELVASITECDKPNLPGVNYQYVFLTITSDLRPEGRGQSLGNP